VDGMLYVAGGYYHSYDTDYYQASVEVGMFSAVSADAGSTGSAGFNDALKSKLPADGKIQVRNNVIKIAQSTIAYIVIKGSKAGEKVDLVLYNQAGIPLTGIGQTVVLDATGWGYASFDGRIAGRPLKTGVYWIVASGGVNDRQPVLVKSTD